MTLPVEPVRPLIEPAVPARRVVRGREQAQDGGSKQREHEEQPREEREDDGGLHVDVLA
jgi:hypothetical protein